MSRPSRAVIVGPARYQGGPDTNYVIAICPFCNQFFRASQLHITSSLKPKGCSSYHLGSRGLSVTPIGKMYKRMMGRCYNRDNASFSAYGGKGITVFQSWRDNIWGFWEFINQLLDQLGYTEEDLGSTLSLERKNSTLGYCPANCTLASASQQSANSEGWAAKTPTGYRNVQSYETKGRGTLYKYDFKYANKRYRKKKFTSAEAAAKDRDLLVLAMGIKDLGYGLSFPETVLTRPSRDAYYKKIVEDTASRGTCGRAKQGAIIVYDRRIIVSQYNGPLPGAPHCSIAHCDTTKPCTRAIHAEMGAIVFAAKKGIAIEGASMYCSTVPCKKCAEGIIQAGIVELGYINSYRNTEGLELLKNNGVKVRQL